MRKHYAVSWGCSLLAGIFSSMALMGLVLNWGSMPLQGRYLASVLGSLVGAALFWAFPAVLALTAIASSKGRPRGRLGFGPLLITAVGFLVSMIERLLALQSPA